ncbi:MAG: NAD(P)/FAD-dependent oxidoreductase [Halioglobus sp.]
MLEKLQPITADDDEIREALAEAHTPSLLLALVHLTGDFSLIRESGIKLQISMLDDGEASISEEQRSWVRSRAFAALRALRESPELPPPPSNARIHEMLGFLLNREVSPEYVEFLTQELGLHGENAFAQPRIFDTPEPAREAFKVLVIGAGMSGLLAGIRLQEAGIAFEIVEKTDDVGGTWHLNTYPGCRVDTANHAYSYSFRPRDWPQYFSSGEELQRYFSEAADAYGLRRHIRFQTEVVSARFEATSGTWQLELKGPQGALETVQANAIISAVGQLNRPAVPDIPGREKFAGPSFHSARWDHGVDLNGKRVGVIGSGASAFQFVPHVAREAASVTIFQRTPPWVLPMENYFAEVAPGKHWLLNHVPFYARWYRFTVFWRSSEGMLDAVKADGDWRASDPYHSISQTNYEACELLAANVREQLAGRPDLIEKCIPDYPFAAKRALIDDGAWFRALREEHVHLLTEPISDITARGVRTQDGIEHEFDVIVFGTGFRASEFLSPMKIYGLDGAELHEAWAGEPRAYQGITVPGFPNLFCCYGPNTNIVINGSIVFFSECEMRYILGCIALLLGGEHAFMDVRRRVHDRYNERVDAGNREMAWGYADVRSWYKNASGRITQNWPFTMLEFWQQSREPNSADYDFG